MIQVNASADEKVENLITKYTVHGKSIHSFFPLEWQG
jgi:hypothetical protein